MGKLQKNKDGFTVVEVLLVLILVVLIGFAGWYVYHTDHKTTANTNTTSNTSTSSNVYAGWKTDTTSISGLSFKYPSTWTVNPNVEGAAICTGGVVVGVIPSASEISQAMTAAQYYLEIYKYGTPSSNCAPDGTDFSTLQFSSMNSSDQIQSGVFSNDWLTFFSFNDTQTQFYPSQPDTAILTANSYNGSQTAFTNSGTVQGDGATYQVGIVTTTVQGQVETPVNISVGSFKSSQLYKDTVNILNSIN